MKLNSIYILVLLMFYASGIHASGYKILSLDNRDTVIHISGDDRSEDYDEAAEYLENHRSFFSPYVFGGMGLGFSIEYERKLSKRYSGLGIRTGLGLAAIDISYLTIPLQLNYLIGGKGAYLELGSGLIYLRNNASTENPYFFVFGVKLPGYERDHFFFSCTVGCRVPFRASPGWGILRFGVTPYFGYGQYSALPYICIDVPL
jgi:hypothetical protein